MSINGEHGNASLIAKLGAPSRIWPREPQDCNVWLSWAQGIRALAAAVGCNLQPAGREVAVVRGGRADLVFELLDPVSGVASGRRLVAEVSLHPADDDHLWRLQRYALALRAVAAVMIAPTFAGGQLAAIVNLNRVLRPGPGPGFWALGLEVTPLSGRNKVSLMPLVLPAVPVSGSGRLEGMAAALGRVVAPENLYCSPGALALQTYSCIREAFFQIAAAEDGGWHFACVFAGGNDVQNENLFHASARAAAALRAQSASLWQPRWMQERHHPMLARITGPLAAADPDAAAEQIGELLPVCNRHLAGLDRDFVDLGARSLEEVEQ